MDETATEVFYTLLYLVLAACVIYPPIEFISAGVTIPMLCSPILGSETEQFIQYHIKRSSITLFVYSVLPFGYFLGLWALGYRDYIYILWNSHGFYFSECMTIISIILPLTASYLITSWSMDNWKYHPISVKVSRFCNNNANWLSVVSDINREYCRMDKIRIQSNAVCKIVATENWIIKIMPLTICIAHQPDANLEVIHSDTHYPSYDNSGLVQFLNIEIKSSRDKVDTFVIRLNAQDFKDFQERCIRIITVLPNVLFHKSVIDKFIDAFKEVILDNPRFSTEETLENCIGCMQSIANIKLQKLCNSNVQDMDECVTCYCRPLWCADCMAKWFALRQDQEQQETWLSSKCTCPMCRAKFCLLDVCLIDQEIIT